MYPHKEVEKEDFSGKLESSLNYSKQQVTKKRSSDAQKIAILQVLDNIRYYQNKKVDSEFMRYAIKYHLDQAVKFSVSPKTVLSSDKQLSRNYAEQKIVLSRLLDAIGA